VRPKVECFHTPFHPSFDRMTTASKELASQICHLSSPLAMAWLTAWENGSEK